jgi:hypothetical protein
VQQQGPPKRLLTAAQSSPHTAPAAPYDLKVPDLKVPDGACEGACDLKVPDLKVPDLKVPDGA